MNERDSRNQKEIEEFILIKNDKTPIFRETDVVVRPIAIGKNGPEFEVLDKENNPKMLEVNIGGFSAWLFQFTSGTAFREYTDEILDYCYNNKHKLKFKIRNSLEF